MLRLFSMLFLFAVVLGSGIAHGVWSGRWNISDGPERAAAHLSEVPLTVGDWDGRVSELSPRHMRVAELSGAHVCEFVNRRTGSVVSTLLVCGRPGPVSVHTPEVCYGGAGYEPIASRARYTNASLPAAAFWVCDFQKPQAATPDRLRIFYAWNAQGTWAAPENPRLAFFRQPALYKFYVIRKLAKADESLEGDPAVDFLENFLPQLDKRLFPAS
jgi:hypothetical protein